MEINPEECVILVNAHDKAIGTMKKFEAHEQGLLHRAFSVLLFNKNGEILLQQRAEDKYHSGGLWTNTCCSHPMPSESTLEAAERRLQEEMGIKALLTLKFSFTYKCELDNDMMEHEYDHVFYGRFDGEPVLNPDEAMDFKYMSISDIKSDIKSNPDNYTVWFKLIMDRVERYKF